MKIIFTKDLKMCMPTNFSMRKKTKTDFKAKKNKKSDKSLKNDEFFKDEDFFKDKK